MDGRLLLVARFTCFMSSLSFFLLASSWICCLALPSCALRIHGQGGTSPRSDLALR